MGKKLPKETVKKEQAGEAIVRAKPKEIEILGLVSKEIDTNSSALRLKPYIALKYFNSDWQCFSDWENQELKQFSKFITTLSNFTWEQVYKSGSKIPKHGLAYTKYELKDVKSEALKPEFKH